MLYAPALPNTGAPFSTACAPSTNSGDAMLKNSKNPGMFCEFSTTAPIPPAEIVPIITTAISAVTITIACIKSDALSAKNPPRMV